MKRIIFGVLILIITVIGLGAYSFIFGICEPNREYSKLRVIEHLKSKSLPVDYLQYDSERSSGCYVAFIYKTPDKEIYFSVIDNVKVTWWDTNERGPI